MNRATEFEIGKHYIYYTDHIAICKLLKIQKVAIDYSVFHFQFPIKGKKGNFTIQLTDYEVSKLIYEHEDFINTIEEL